MLLLGRWSKGTVCEKIEKERAGQLLHLAEDNKKPMFMVCPSPNHKCLTLKRSCKKQKPIEILEPQAQQPHSFYV